MRNLVEKMMVKAIGKVNEIKSQVSNDKGASDMVAIIAIIVIVLAVAIIFRGVLTNIVNSVGSKVISWINSN